MCVHRVDLGSLHSSLITSVAPFGHNNDCFISTVIITLCDREICRGIYNDNSEMNVQHFIKLHVHACRLEL